MTKKLVSDCCGAEYEPFLSFRLKDEGWYCTECGKECTPSPQNVDIGAKEKEGEDEKTD